MATSEANSRSHFGPGEPATADAAAGREEEVDSRGASCDEKTVAPPEGIVIELATPRRLSEDQLHGCHRAEGPDL